MRVFLDVGNSQIKWACSQPHRPLQIGAPIPHTVLTADELYQSLIEHFDPLALTPENIWIAHVGAPAIKNLITEWARNEYLITPQEITSQARCGPIQNGYTDPHLLGIDRLLALWGARLHIPTGPIFLVQCGTAITLDALDPHDQHLGGFIIPGLHLMRTSITQLIPHFSPPDVPATLIPGSLLARNPYHGIWGGTALAAVNMIESVRCDLQTYTSHPYTAVVTGGDAEILLPMLTSDGLAWQHHPNLVLEGMHAYVQALTTRSASPSSPGSSYTVAKRIST